MQRWRIGRKVPINVYEGDAPVCQCHTPEMAQRIVDAMNDAEWDAGVDKTVTQLCAEIRAIADRASKLRKRS